MSAESEFSPDEWQTLQFAPFWVFSALLGSYRNFDPFEYDAFLGALENAASAPGRLSNEVIASVTAEPRRVAEKYKADSRTIARGLCAVSAILNKAPATEAALFREMLILDLGTGIAKARGRFGRVMSKEDEETLELISAFLD
jgi:hypothetical protein